MGNCRSPVLRGLLQTKPCCSQVCCRPLTQENGIHVKMTSQKGFIVPKMFAWRVYFGQKTLILH